MDSSAGKADVDFATGNDGRNHDRRSGRMDLARELSVARDTEYRPIFD